MYKYTNFYYILMFYVFLYYYNFYIYTIFSYIYVFLQKKTLNRSKRTIVADHATYCESLIKYCKRCRRLKTLDIRCSLQPLETCKIDLGVPIYVNIYGIARGEVKHDVFLI